VTAQTNTADFKPSGNIIIQVFGYSKTDLNTTTGNLAFGIGRAHFGYSYKFSPQISATLIVDAAGRTTSLGTNYVIDANGNQLSVTNTGREGSFYTAFLKFAYIQWKVNDWARFQIGGILQNHYITQEKFWGYRYLYETFQDRYYGSPSGDYGAIGYFEVSPTLNFDITITNGEGIRSNQAADGKIKYAVGIDYVPVKQWHNRLYYENNSTTTVPGTGNQQLISFFSGWQLKDNLRTGIDLNYRINNQQIIGRNLGGGSIFAAYGFRQKWELFARYDRLRSNKISNQSNNWNYLNDGYTLIGGIQYEPVKTVRFALSYQGWRKAYIEGTNKDYIFLSTEFKL
jgi:hypothetical protein